MRPLLAIAIDPLWIVFSQFGDRFGQGISVAPRKALMADVSSDELRTEAYRLRQSLLIAGACIGSIIAGGILFFYRNDYRLVFSSALIPSCMALALLIIVVKPAQTQRKTLMMPAEITGLLAGSNDFYDRYPQHSQSSQQTYNPIYWRDLPYLGAEYWLLFVVAICFNLGNSSDAFLLMRSVEIAIPPALIPVGLIAMNLVFALASYPLSAIRDRSLKIRLLLAGFLLHVIVYFGVTIVSTDLQIWCLFALYGLHVAIVQGLLLDLVDRSIDPARRGTALSFFNISIGIALLIANLLAGWCWQSFGSGFTFAVGAFFGCIAMLILLIGSNE
jgi:sugar phosphate permease